ncbi:MAG: gluconate 2-dehydrogenase subunit 3 family protein [Balneolaceae bacterium]|nr:gluconate 2-dehydrogenase subunit 3 family protein [Balneolaceae bacterium]
MEKIDRKEAIKRTAALMGGVVFAPSILGVLKGCTASPGGWSPELFNSRQAAFTTAMANTILPGAVEQGVPAFIESMVKDIYTEEQREMYLEAMDDMMDKCLDEMGSEFADLEEGSQFEFATLENNSAIEAGFGAGPQFFLILKELTMVGFFTSEYGATEVLRYQEIPGTYQACIPFEDVGKTWATD